MSLSQTQLQKAKKAIDFLSSLTSCPEESSKASCSRPTSCLPTCTGPGESSRKASGSKESLSTGVSGAANHVSDNKSEKGESDIPFVPALTPPLLFIYNIAVLK